MSTASPPGWHPDPNLPPGTLRWWDGNQWTEHIHSVPSTPAVAQPQVNAMAVTPLTASATQQPAASASLHDASASAGYVAQPARGGSLVRENPTTFRTIAVVGAYLAIAVSTGIVFLGILPAVLSIRAFQRGERLAPLGMAAAALAVLLAISVFTHR